MKKFILLALTLSASFAAAQTGTVSPATVTPAAVISRPPLPVMVRAELRTPPKDACQLTLLKSEQELVTFDAAARQGGLKVQDGDTVKVVLECDSGKAVRVLTAHLKPVTVTVGGPARSLDWDAYYGNVPGLQLR